MLGHRFATRINSFASGAQAYWPGLEGKPSLMQMIRRAATVDGLSELDLNFPDHVGDDPVVVGRMVRDCGLQVSGLAMRYYTNPAFKRGAFTNPDPVERSCQLSKLVDDVDAAALLGAEYVRVTAGQGYPQVTFEDGVAWASDGLRSY
jgi:xylose isomerase